MSRRTRRRQRSREHRLRSRVATVIMQAVREVLPDLAKHGKPASKVNWGWCEDVAEAARDYLLFQGISATIVRDDDELRTTTNEIYGDGGYSHAWIWVEGKHHDAEAPFGVRRWLDLPHFRRWLNFNPNDGVGVVDIVPVLSHGDEQRLFFHSAKMERALRSVLGSQAASLLRQQRALDT